MYLAVNVSSIVTSAISVIMHTMLYTCRNEVRSTFNLWSTLLAETRKVSRERASLAEVMASEMVARLEVMAKDVQVLTKKVCVCVIRDCVRLRPE